MYPQHGYPYQPPPPKQGPSALTIVLIVLVGLFVLGVGSCLVVCVGIGAAATEADPVTNGQPGSPPNAGSTATTTPPPANPEDPPDEPAEPSDPDNANGQASPGNAAPTPPTKPQGKWVCSATGFVRICTTPTLCTNYPVSGLGASADQGAAMMMARNACQGQMIARGGGGGPCSVHCSFR